MLFNALHLFSPYFNFLYTGTCNPYMPALTNSEDSDEMRLNTAFHQGLSSLLRQK